MEASIYLVRNGTVWPLSDSVPLEVLSIDGIGTAPVVALTERGPLQHGDSDRDFRLDPRVINLILQAHPDETHDYHAIRALLNRLFTPSNVTLTLRIVFGDNITYDIDTRSLGVRELPSNIDQTILTKAGVQLRAANPLFYNPVGVNISFGLTGGGNAFTVPTFVPTGVGASTINQTIALAYAGTFDAFPVVTIYGPATNPVLTNDSTGDTIDFTGITINNGDFYTVDLRYGRKIVYRNGVTSDNRIAELTDNSDIDTFRIVAEPTVADGVNNLRFTASSVNSTTQVYVSYFNQYAGI